VAGQEPARHGRGRRVRDDPDPDPDPEKFAKYWTSEIPYVVGTFGKRLKGVQFVEWKSEDNSSFAGYDGILKGVAARTLDELKAIHDKGK
jgi:hypothetical protein